MADYIKREYAIMTAMDYDGLGDAQEASDDIAVGLASIPAADVRENVRGEWIEHDDETPLECSICGFEENRFYNFCPNCGADMRKADRKYSPKYNADMGGKDYDY